ncbi:MAG: hypothetical protein GY705_21695 [Bacteroidetes bacterium]|nr:hypothetical protein [Bacteroidota bacterium]
MRLFIFILILTQCATASPPHKNTDLTAKITFNIDVLNEEGLQGSPDGLRSLDYEFCIPANEAYEKEVKQIDPSVKIQRQSKGRINCSEAEYLCIGTTYQKKYKKVLFQLASLEYVKKIDECFYE